MNKKNNLKIAMIGHKSFPSRLGGIERVLTILCPLMVKKGHKVTCYNRSGIKSEADYKNQIKGNSYHKVRIKKVWTWNRKGFAAMTSSFAAALCAAFGNYDIVHFHAEGPCAAMWIPKLFGKRCIATVHGLDWQRDKWRKGFGAMYIKLGEKTLVKYADEIIVLSKGAQNYFREEYGRDTVFIPNGISRPKVREADLITKMYGLKKGEYFCSLSRLTEEKAIHHLIEAYKRIETDKKLVIAGASSDTDSYVNYLKNLAADNSNIIFTGFVSGAVLDELYSNAYTYILPSKLEGMPLTLLEAMSYGNAVIGSDILEIAEVMGGHGILFKKGNVADLAEKMQYFSDYPEVVEEYKCKSADYICNKYNWDDVVDATIKLYQGE